MQGERQIGKECDSDDSDDSDDYPVLLESGESVVCRSMMRVAG